MLVRNRNENNRELKEYLHLYGITYKMLAEVSGYSYKYLNKIMRRPLSEWSEGIIRQSADRIIKSYVPKEDGDLTVRLQAEHITFAALAHYAEEPVTQSQIYEWVVGNVSLTAQRRSIIENSIKRIREERRLYYESD